MICTSLVQAIYVQYNTILEFLLQIKHGKKSLKTRDAVCYVTVRLPKCMPNDYGGQL